MSAQPQPEENKTQTPEVPSRQLVIEWTPDHENILIEWADQAMCYRWLHSEAHAYFSFQNSCYTLPVIVISAVTGTANLAQGQVPAQYQDYYLNVVGFFNIVASIITIIQQYYKITQLTESHRVSNIAWDKFQRNIKIELAKHPDERMAVIQMIKICKEEFDRLMETSPMIPKFIVNNFKAKFQKTAEYDEIKKPEICDYLVSSERGRNQWATPENLALKNQKRAQKIQQNTDTMKTFITSFTNMNGRKPYKYEVIDNIRDNGMDILDIEVAISQIEKENPELIESSV